MHFVPHWHEKIIIALGALWLPVSVWYTWKRHALPNAARGANGLQAVRLGLIIAGVTILLILMHLIWISPVPSSLINTPQD